MYRRMKRIFSTILAAIISISLLSACEKTENIPEETTVSETTVATVPTDLTEEEMAIWESMPDIVTMRVYRSETTEICYIKKDGTINQFISDEYYDKSRDTDWIINKINDNKAEQVNNIDIHNLILFYSTLMNIDNNSKITSLQQLQTQQYTALTGFEIYGIRNNIELNNEFVLVSFGGVMQQYIRKDPNGENLFNLYKKMDEYIPIL